MVKNGLIYVHPTHTRRMERLHGSPTALFSIVAGCMNTPVGAVHLMTTASKRVNELGA